MSTSETSRETKALMEAINALVAGGRQPIATLGLEAALLEELGFPVREGTAFVPEVERLAAPAIRGALSPNALRWLERLDVLPVVGSTSDLLMERAEREPVGGHLVLAELQLGGRGRRGRHWQSPFGANLAMSMGFRLPLPPARLGGFSLAVGLALLDALETLGFQGAELKWPNDVLLGGNKLAGVLVDVLLDGDGVQLVVGVGVNVVLPAATRRRIDQPAIDLASAGVAVSRNRLAGALTSSILEFACAFAEDGFGPMRSAFDTHHALQGKPCRVLEGNTVTEGIVRGVGVDGELLLESAGGGMQSFAAGEVSLRSRS